MENVNSLANCGFHKPVNNLELKDKEELVTSLCYQRVIVNSLCELLQFKEGILKVEGMDLALSKYSVILQPFYCLQIKNLTPGMKCCCYSFLYYL